MTNRLEFYKCDMCKMIIQVVLEGEGTLVCCNEEMKLLTPSTHDLGEEKHVPVLYEGEDDEKTVKIGAQAHPMTKEHYIQFIEVTSKDGVWVKRKYLTPEDEAMMKFRCHCEDGIDAVEFCNIHGLWATKF